MTKPDLITKFMAWMDLYNDDKEIELIENHLTEKGERCIEAYVPLLDKKISGVHKNVEKAFDLFFTTFSDSIDEYIKDKPDIAAALEKQIRDIEEESRKEMKERLAKRKEPTEFEKLERDIASHKFNQDLDESIRMIENTVRDVSLVLDEEESGLYIKVLSRDFFDPAKSNERVSAEMQVLCRKELKDTGMSLLFTKCRVTENSVIVIGVTEQL